MRMPSSADSGQQALPSTGPVLHRLPDAVSQAHAVADQVRQWLAEALAVRSRATLVVSGGKTPVAMWQALRQSNLDWSRVGITLADERWVPEHDQASNGGLVHQHLLQGRAAAARWVPLYTAGDKGPQAALPGLEQRLRAQLSWPADVVVLGMGADGHTASWFPGQPLPLDERLCLAAPVPEPPNVPVPRVSLSPAALLSARHLLVQLQGQDKEPVLQQALRPPLSQGEDIAQAALPIRRALWAAGQATQVYFTA